MQIGLVASNNRCQPATSAAAQSQKVREAADASIQVIASPALISSANPFMSLFLNSLVRKRPTSLRSYYSLQTLCASCAATNDARERRKILILALAVIVAIFVFIMVLMTSGHSRPIDWR